MYSFGGGGVDMMGGGLNNFTGSPIINQAGSDAFRKRLNALLMNNPLSTNANQGNAGTGMYNDPFGTAMSGTKSGTLQPYVNRMTQNASNALYGGLLGYSPQSMVAGDAGGTPVNSTAPQFNIPSALSQYGNGLNFTGFGNRSWMGGNNGTA